MSASSTSCIEIKDLRFSYPAEGFALRLPELKVPSGSLCVIVGPSGSGKTTLLHLLAGILRGADGEVRVEGRQLSALSPGEIRAFRLEKIGLVFQSFELIEHLSVTENILLPFLIAGRKPPPAEAIAELASEAGIAAHLRKAPETLSQGERQRVALCRALLPSPALILADEPTGNLDPATTLRIMELLIDQARSRGATLVMVTHDHSLLPRFDQVVELGSLEEVEA